MSYNFSVFNNQIKRSTAGFGLVELLVSVAIFSLVATVVLVQQSSFNGSVLLRSQAYDIALRLREVQLSAVSAMNSADVSGSSGSFRSVLGIHFSTSTTANGKYAVFKDSSSGTHKNNFYDSGEEYDIQGKLDPRFEIREIIGNGRHGAVSVVFERPNFDARFFSGPNAQISTSTLKIIVARRGATGTGKGDIRTVEVTSTGQISVK